MTTAPRDAERRDRTSLPGDRVSVGLAVSAAITALTLGVAFGLMILDVESFWVVYVLGFGVVLPFALGAVTYVWRDADSPDGDSQDPLVELRMQYARGEMSEAEFERRRERLTEPGSRATDN